jgi:hypothetical protein
VTPLSSIFKAIRQARHSPASTRTATVARYPPLSRTGRSRNHSGPSQGVAKAYTLTKATAKPQRMRRSCALINYWARCSAHRHWTNNRGPARLNGIACVGAIAGLRAEMPVRASRQEPRNAAVHQASEGADQYQSHAQDEEGDQRLVGTYSSCATFRLSPAAKFSPQRHARPYPRLPCAGEPRLSWRLRSRLARLRRRRYWPRIRRLTSFARSRCRGFPYAESARRAMSAWTTHSRRR